MAGCSEYKIATYPLQSFKIFRIFRWIANSHKFISIFRTFQYIHTDFIWKGIFRIVIWALTHQLTNMPSLFIVQHLTNLSKYSIYGDEYARNLYVSKYSKYNKELPKDMRRAHFIATHCNLQKVSETHGCPVHSFISSKTYKRTINWFWLLLEGVPSA